MDRRFTLTEDHVSLLRHAYVRWEDCEYGAPAIDCKRPYGNSSVEVDIAEILDWDLGEYEELNEGQSRLAAGLHRETQTALQVILATGSFEPGEYKGNGFEWERA